MRVYKTKEYHENKFTKILCRNAEEELDTIMNLYGNEVIGDKK